MKSILDPSFRYVSSVATDLRKTFARIRRDRRLALRKGKQPTVVPAAVLAEARPRSIEPRRLLEAAA